MQEFVDFLAKNLSSLAVTVGLLVFMLLYTSYFLSRLLRRRRFIEERLLAETVMRPIPESKAAELTKAIDQKREGFLNIATISFHFVNEDEVQNFYNDYFKEPTVEQIVSEMASEVSGDVKGQFPKVFEAKAGGKDLSKWISTIKLPGISVAEMFRRYQRETIKSNQVTLGLELVEVDLSDLNTFDKLVSEFEAKYSGLLDRSRIEDQRTQLKKRAAEKTMVRLENATGWLLVEGKFKISELSQGSYKCIYEHPVIEYFAEEEKKITISLVLDKDSLERNIAGNYAQSVGRSIPLKVYGKVFQPIDRKADVWELQITPTAVY